MKSLSFQNRVQPQLKIVLPEGEEVILTRRKVPVSQLEEHSQKLDSLAEKHKSKELSEIQYAFAVIDLLVEGFDPAKFNDLDVYYLKEIQKEITELSTESNAEKKKRVRECLNTLPLLDYFSRAEIEAMEGAEVEAWLEAIETHRDEKRKQFISDLPYAHAQYKNLFRAWQAEISRLDRKTRIAQGLFTNTANEKQIKRSWELIRGGRRKKANSNRTKA